MDVYRNLQWIVTPEGIEGISDNLRYWIAMERVLETTERDGIIYYNWPVHIAEKECVWIRPFIQAFIAAVRFHNRSAKAPVDEEMLRRSLEYAKTYDALEI